MKTPEQMAEEYRENHDECEFARDAFLAGYQAAKNENQAKMQELKANWKFCCEDKTRLLNELAIAERAKDQLADADKVMPQWISVKERLPEEDVAVLVYGQILNDPPDVIGVRRRYIGDQEWKYTWESEDGFIYREDDVTHWMPLPTPPEANE